MTESNSGVAQAKWQVTATTMECDMVNDFVTVIVNRDWTCKCTWWNRYKKVAEESKAKFPTGIKLKINKCQGPDCKYVVGYRDKLRDEEEKL